MSRKVTRVIMHELKVVIPGIGSLPTSLPTQSKNLNLDMREGERGIEITLNGKLSETYIVPYANVQIYFVAPEMETVKVTTTTAKKA